jgi:hypothetical protein
VAAYILGEFGFLIAERPGMSGEEQFRILHQHWATSDNHTRAILLTAYAKLANLYEECRPLVAPVFARCTNSVDVEIQQRAAEYSSMREAFSPEAVEDLLREMPPFEDNKTSALEQRLREKEGDDSAAVVKAARPSAAERKRAAASAAAAQAIEAAEAQVEDDVAYEEDPISPMSSKELLSVDHQFLPKLLTNFLIASLYYQTAVLAEQNQTLIRLRKLEFPKKSFLRCEKLFPISAHLLQGYCLRTHFSKSELSTNILVHKDVYLCFLVT